jgi:hypothetical protein
MTRDSYFFFLHSFLTLKKKLPMAKPRNQVQSMLEVLVDWCEVEEDGYKERINIQITTKKRKLQMDRYIL